jgi:DNA-binding MarR family transcriptional regulator
MDKPIEQLINEIRLLYQSLVKIGEEIHAGSNISMGMRAVLEFLDRNGDSTVPHMARQRRVTRQRIQILVNALLDRGLVQTRDNPASRRSPLIALSASGARTIVEMRRAEGREVTVDVCDEKIQEAAHLLARVREALEEGRELKSE